MSSPGKENSKSKLDFLKGFAGLSTLFLKILGRIRGELTNNFLLIQSVDDVLRTSTNRENWNTHVMSVTLTAKSYQTSPTKLQFCEEKGGYLGDCFLSGEGREVPHD